MFDKREKRVQTSEDDENARSTFLKGISAAAGMAAGLNGVPALRAQKSPNDVTGIACIGVGTRGHGLLQETQAVPNTEVRIICDLYTGKLARPRPCARIPNHAWCTNGKRLCWIRISMR